MKVVPLRGVDCFRNGSCLRNPYRVSVPSRGGFFSLAATISSTASDFRPLAGCRLFQCASMRSTKLLGVSVPLRGVACFWRCWRPSRRQSSFRPFTGCGLFLGKFTTKLRDAKFPSPCGVWVVSKQSTRSTGIHMFPSPCGVWVVSPCRTYRSTLAPFPSPCGVWVVSVKLHIISGATGKRIVNSAVLLYHIGRWFINSKLRNCKVPCEAHKTAT